MSEMKPETTFLETMGSAIQYLEKASSALNQCECSGTCREAALRSRMDLIMELATDEPAEIGISPELLEMYGVE